MNCSDCKNNGTQICSLCCSYHGIPDRWEAKPKTNADRFRAKSDEELAEAITADWCSIVCPGGSFFCDGECKTKVLDWLRQETDI